jgi:hypothetical protein
MEQVPSAFPNSGNLTVLLVHLWREVHYHHWSIEFKLIEPMPDNLTFVSDD